MSYHLLPAVQSTVKRIMRNWLHTVSLSKVVYSKKNEYYGRLRIRTYGKVVGDHSEKRIIYSNLP